MSSSLEQAAKPSAPAANLNEFSGEEIVSFSDCSTVRDARERRVAKILASSPAVHAEGSKEGTHEGAKDGIHEGSKDGIHEGSKGGIVEDAKFGIESPPEAVVGLPIKVRSTEITTRGIGPIILGIA